MIDKKKRMNYKLIIALWVIFTVSIIYWDVQKWEDKEPISDCHKAQINIYHDRPMCAECKMYCEVVNENR